jgi:hypothetical protein
MRWFRSNRGTSGALALFALALQIALAFGHIHLRDFAGVPGVVVAHATAPDPTSDHNNGHSTDDCCLICAAAKLAGTLVLPSQIALVLPVSSTDEPHVSTATYPVQLDGRGDKETDHHDHTRHIARRSVGSGLNSWGLRFWLPVAQRPHSRQFTKRATSAALHLPTSSD